METNNVEKAPIINGESTLTGVARFRPALALGKLSLAGAEWFSPSARLREAAFESFAKIIPTAIARQPKKQEIFLRPAELLEIARKGWCVRMDS